MGPNCTLLDKHLFFQKKQNIIFSRDCQNHLSNILVVDPIYPALSAGSCIRGSTVHPTDLNDNRSTLRAMLGVGLLAFCPRTRRGKLRYVWRSPQGGERG